ncbi:MAG: porin family protein [Phaeodactylibacter sp.]|uniref:porin family protein n=1 Tax=Phaeodactylibacter sp. TaxID=1940289 RepID=UPI0032EBE92A
MLRTSLIVILALLGNIGLQAQEFSGGFRAGLNFTTINGPSEMNADGAELENFDFSNGFHVGAVGNLRFTDIFSLRAELLYSQKGGVYNYAGESYWVFTPTDGSDAFFATGNRETTLEITNSYIDIPITGVARFNKFELSAGMSVGFLVASRAAGELRFSGTSPQGNTIAPFVTALDFNYFDGPFRREDIGEVELREIDNRPVEIPKNLGAYYQGQEEDENLFNVIDVGLVGGVAYYLNRGLFLGLRLNYGISDVTRSNQDISRRALEDSGEYIFRDDDDQNLNIQVSVGFSF